MTAIKAEIRYDEHDEHEMLQGRPAPGRQCIYCHEIIVGFNHPDRRYCSDTCSLAHSEACKRGFYSAECARCAEPRSAHDKTVQSMNVQYFCPDGSPAVFDDFLGRTQREYDARQVHPNGQGDGRVQPFYADEERAEMYRENEPLLEKGEERWTDEERSHNDE